MSGNSERDAHRPPEISPDVLFRRVDDELVLVKLATNEIFALNPTGARIWELLSEGVGVDDTIGRLSVEYAQGEPVVREQVETFVGELRAEGFLLS